MLFYGGLGIYKYLVDFAGAGATVPLTGFGYNLAKGSIEAVKENGLVGAFIGGTKAAARWNCCCHFLWIYCFPYFKTQNEETVGREKNPRKWGRGKICQSIPSMLSTNLKQRPHFFAYNPIK